MFKNRYQININKRNDLIFMDNFIPKLDPNNLINYVLPPCFLLMIDIGCHHHIKFRMFSQF